MMIKKQIPNLFTLLNLFSGIIAIIMAMSDNLVVAAFFVMLGIFFDFFDGFFARVFKVEGEFGKQLDSLADVVTSGVAPGLIMFQLLFFSTQQQWFMQLSSEVGDWHNFNETNLFFLPLAGLIIPLASAYRLANFNIDERQTSSFIGLPTPAFALFVISLPLILNYGSWSFVINLIHNPYFLLVVTLLGSYLLNAELPLFSLKFKNYSFNENRLKYIFIIISIILIAIFKVVSIPIIIIVYVLLSIFNNFNNSK